MLSNKFLYNKDTILTRRWKAVRVESAMISFEFRNFHLSSEFSFSGTNSIRVTCFADGSMYTLYIYIYTRRITLADAVRKGWDAPTRSYLKFRYSDCFAKSREMLPRWVLGWISAAVLVCSSNFFSFSQSKKDQQGCMFIRGNHQIIVILHRLYLSQSFHIFYSTVLPLQFWSYSKGDLRFFPSSTI